MLLELGIHCPPCHSHTQRLRLHNEPDSWGRFYYTTVIDLCKERIHQFPSVSKFNVKNLPRSANNFASLHLLCPPRSSWQAQWKRWSCSSLSCSYLFIQWLNSFCEVVYVFWDPSHDGTDNLISNPDLTLFDAEK